MEEILRNEKICCNYKFSENKTLPLNLVIKFICILRRFTIKITKKKYDWRRYKNVSLHKFAFVIFAIWVCSGMDDNWHIEKTYLLEAAIHDSDLLAGELGLSQKLLYRHRSGGLLPRSRVLKVEERLFRSRRVRRRRHDLWFCRRLKLSKACSRDKALPLLPFSPFPVPLGVYGVYAAKSHHHRYYLRHRASHCAFRLSIVSLRFAFRFFLLFLCLAKRKILSLSLSNEYYKTLST